MMKEPCRRLGVIFSAAADCLVIRSPHLNHSGDVGERRLADQIAPAAMKIASP